MKHENSRLSYIEGLKTVRNLVESRYPDVSGRLFDEMLSKLAHYHYNRKKFILLGQEREVYNLLIENSHNPFTVYRWLLLERIPDEVRFQLRQGQISPKKALSEAFKRRRERLDINGEAVKEMGLSLIRGM
ncbi:hypothetical protein K9M79_02520 [Candidatus Woesearchaeota archaeon]|nr:hypothetical protein [Candidatus Woesearchaeota archaeon]